jgi:hypothetical protein
MSLPELLQRAAAGDEGVQAALLDEVEPLLFGYFRSLLPATDEAFDRAVALTHAALLGFLLDLRAGRARAPDAKALRGACHRIAVAVLRCADPVLLAAEGDAETGALTPVAVPLARAWEEALPAPVLQAVAAGLQGARTRGWDEALARLETGGLVRRGVSERDT